MDLGALRTFIAVARQGGFSAVARTQGVEPSSVSRVVAAIEREVGELLFQRTTRKLTLTEAGSLYLARIEPLIAQLDEATEEVRAHGRGPVGTVRLSTSVAFGQTMVVPLLGKFVDAFPVLKLELIMNDANTDLIGDAVDLAIRLAPSVEANVIASKLFETRYHTVAAPSWLAAHPLNRPEDLAHHPVLRFSLPGFRDRWLFQNDEGEVLTVPVAGNIIMSSPLALYEAALAGLGVALLPDWLVGQDLRSGRLIDCFDNCRATATEFATGAWLIYPSKSFMPNKVRVTIDFLRQYYSRSFIE